jgi:hypothetical protein
LLEILDTVTALAAEHRAIVSRAQGSRSRLVTVELTLKTLDALSPRQGELLKESTLAVSHGLYRAAHVAAFACIVDALHSRLELAGDLPKLAAIRPKWKLTTVEDLRDQGDFQVIDAAKEIGSISKPMAKSLHGLLHRRNLCAHPTGYVPTMDEALGFLSEGIQLLRVLQT